MELFDMLGIDGGYVLLGAIAAVLILFILVIVLFTKQKKLVKKYESFMKGAEGSSLEDLVTKRFSEIDSMKDTMVQLDQRLKKNEAGLLHTFQKMSLVKYDAFQEMGGNLSFVLVLLTANNDGWIINAMHSSREGCYIYSKDVVEGECSVPLSEEEKQALEEARSKHI